jgi:hypothetical protein
MSIIMAELGESMNNSKEIAICTYSRYSMCFAAVLASSVGGSIVSMGHICSQFDYSKITITELSGLIFRNL